MSSSKDKGKDILLHTWQYYTVIVLQFSLVASVEYLHNPYYLILFVYGILPILDMILPVDNVNPDDKDYKLLIKNNMFKVPVYLSIIADWIVYLWGINYVMTNGQANLFNKIGLLVAVISLEATNFNMAHELFHKTSFISRFMGVSSMLKSMNTHFYIEHNQHHHVWVATPKCTATSKLNQSSFDFIFQSMRGSFKHGWECENARCKELYGSEYSINNFMIYSTLMSLTWPLTGYYFYGYKGAGLQLLIAFGAHCLLELINYLEHYGLTRKLDSATGKYEPVNIHHSWNAPYRVSNYILFKLQRHSDHHENSLKPYQILASYDESPCLPQGYSVCVIVAIIPQLWFAVMNPLVEIYSKKQKPSQEVLDKANALIYKYIACVTALCVALLVVSEMVTQKNPIGSTTVV